MSKKLTETQLENWRKILSIQFGPYAYLMPEEEVQTLKEKMQEKMNEFPED